MYYPCSENKDADQLRGYREADLRLCFRICKSRFSHNEAQISEVSCHLGSKLKRADQPVWFRMLIRLQADFSQIEAKLLWIFDEKDTAILLDCYTVQTLKRTRKISMRHQHFQQKPTICVPGKVGETGAG